MNKYFSIIIMLHANYIILYSQKNSKPSIALISVCKCEYNYKNSSMTIMIFVDDIVPGHISHFSDIIYTIINGLSRVFI